MENDCVGECGMGAEGEALCMGPLEKLDKAFRGEGSGTREAEETRCPCGGSGVALVEKPMGETRLDESLPFGVGIEFGALRVLVHEVAEILDGGVLRCDLVRLCDVGRHLPVPVHCLNGVGVSGGIVHGAVIREDAEE